MRARAIPLAAVSLAVVLGTVLVPLSTAGVAAAGRITLSSNVEELSLRPCLPETVEIGITNHGSRARFVDVSITAEPPVRSSKTGITTYVPARSTVFADVQIFAPLDAVAGTYDVLFETGRSEQLTIPATVVTSPDARCLPRENMTATATSAQDSPDYGPWYAIDGTDTTLWHTRYSPSQDVLPQSITLELGGTYDVAELVYQPRPTGSMNGTITAYTVYGSFDGQTFTELVDGTWAADRTHKTATLDTTAVRYVRLEAREGYGGYASAAEIVLFGRAT